MKGRHKYPLPKVHDLPSSNDPILLARLRDVSSRLAGRVAVALVDLNAEPVVRLALVGCSSDTVFEIGSVTKALTGMLLADLVREGATSLDATVGTVVPTVEGTDLATVSLLELSTHTSGLPSMPGVAADLRMLPSVLLGRNPFHRAPTSVVDIAARQRLRTRGRWMYSNLGGALMGEMLASTTATDYAELLNERILRPLDMRATGVSTRGHGAPKGQTMLGLRCQPWVLRGYSPAGGVFSTIHDIALLAVSLVDGSAPGRTSMDPVIEVPGEPANRQSGLFWIHDGPTVQAPAIAWHNGATGGYSSFIAEVPSTGQAVVILQSKFGTARELQRVALCLLNIAS